METPAVVQTYSASKSGTNLTTIRKGVLVFKNFEKIIPLFKSI
jgi:hypothetical protein